MAITAQTVDTGSDVYTACEIVEGHQLCGTNSVIKESSVDTEQPTTVIVSINKQQLMTKCIVLIPILFKNTNHMPPIPFSYADH